MDKKLYISIICFILCLTGSVQALEFKGTVVPDEVVLEGSAQPVKLNGVGMRTKFFFDIYVGALYLKTPAATIADVLSQESPKRVLMHFVYDEVPVEKLVAGWNEGFEENQNDEQLVALADRIRTFNQMFVSVHAGDEILLDYLPDQGTRVSIKGEVKGVIAGKDFNDALLRIWLGDEPADEALKEAMLNADN
ncbi:MAG: chalcone isomerase family protein [Gammaproteobacteria bacterium]|nr:chalcone isomerase family protein [Gammaproteobacteria bacterium]